uniref:Uncharacterized protein n=1 Tax=Biomphalaria glabrata TaxID=6526 RepID=A0A2C9JGT4_BIOGL
MQRIPFYKGRNANFKVLLEVTDMDDIRITEFFKYLTSDSLINKFATNAKQFLLEKGFDGLSIRLLDNFGLTDYRFTFSSFIHVMSSNFQNGAKRLFLYVSLSGTEYLFKKEIDFDFGGVCRAVDKLVLETQFFRPPARTQDHPSRLYGDPDKTNISVVSHRPYNICINAVHKRIVFDEVTGDKVTGYEKTKNEKTKDEKTGDEVTGDEMTWDEKAKD